MYKPKYSFMIGSAKKNWRLDAEAVNPTLLSYRFINYY